MAPRIKTEPLPPITDEARAAAAADRPVIVYAVSTRLYNPDLGATYQITFESGLDLSLIDGMVAMWVESGYEPCLSPDRPVSAAPAPAPAANPPADRRPGTRAYQAKEERLVVRFGRHKGETLRDIERIDPDYVDWLADQSTQPDIRKAAQKLSLARDMPF